MARQPRNRKRKTAVATKDGEKATLSSQIGEEAAGPLQSRKRSRQASPGPPDYQASASSAAAVVVEEEIRLLEASLVALQSRHQSIDDQQQQSQTRRKEMLNVLAQQLRRKQQLDDSHVQQTKLLEELEVSLTKSRELLQNKKRSLTHNNNNGVNIATEAVEEGMDEMIEVEQQKDPPMEHQASGDASLATGSDLDAESNGIDAVEVEAPLSPAFRRCLAPNNNSDPARLASFARGHSDLEHPNNLFVFFPSISSPALLTKIMDITALEALAEGARLVLLPTGSNNTGGHLTAVATFRRQTLWNTCLDFPLMMAGANDANNDLMTASTIVDEHTDNKDGGSSLDQYGEADKEDKVPTEVVGKDSKSNSLGTSTLGDQEEGGETANQAAIVDDHLDPHVALCPYELGGVCADPFCPYQHLNVQNRPIHESILPRELLPLPELRLPEPPNDDHDSTTDGGGGNGEPESAEDPLHHELAGKAGRSDAMEKTAIEIDSVNDRSTVGNLDDKSVPVGDTDTELSLLLVDDSKQDEPITIVHASDKKSPEDSIDPEAGSTAGMEEFEINSDFVAFGETNHGDTEDDEEDFMNLENAGLVGLTRREQVPGLHSNNESAINERKNHFWWLPQSVEAELLDGPPKRMGLEDWLYWFGELAVVRGQEEGGVENIESVVLEYHGAIPSSDVGICEFTGRIVDCARLLMHGGRFDLCRPLCTIAQNCLNCFVSTEAAGVPLLPSTTKTAEILQTVLETTNVVLEKAYCHQNGLDPSFGLQLTLALLSDFLLRLHAHLAAETDAEADLQWCDAFIKECSRINENPRRRDKFPGIGDTTARRAHFIIGTIKLAVFCKNFSSSRPTDIGADEEGPEGVRQPETKGICIERVGYSLLEDIQVAIACASAIRSGFSLHSVVEDFLKPIWSLVKSSLKSQVGLKEAPRSTVCLRSVVFIGHTIKGVLEGAVDFLKGVAGDPSRLSALSFSSLVQLDNACYGILKSLIPMVLDDADTTMIITLLTPIIGASVSFACQLGFYAKVQLRLLDDLLGNKSKDTAHASFFTYSELLWSQLILLRASLPFTPVTGSKPSPGLHTLLTSELSESHGELAKTIYAYGVHVHHLCLSGDWNILSRFSAIAQKAEPAQAAKHLGAYTRLFQTATHPPFAVGFRTRVYLPLPASLRTIESGCSHFQTFPRSLLVYGWKISELHLDGCELRELPHSIGLHLSNLKVLDISNNHIEFMPGSIAEMTTLDVLIANDNLLTSLPKIAPNLSKLELENNSLESVPNTIWSLKYLEVLKLLGNNFCLAYSTQLVLELPKLRVLSIPAVTEVSVTKDTHQ